jgi:intein/homing endonuclease
MSELPIITFPTVLRTDFSDDEAWTAILEAITAESLEGFRVNVAVVDDRRYESLDVGDLLAIPEDTTPGFVFVVDDETVTTPDHPVLVVRLRFDGRGETFRSVPAGIQSIENNLSIHNMDWAEFASSVDSSGVFRGF